MQATLVFLVCLVVLELLLVDAGFRVRRRRRRRRSCSPGNCQWNSWQAWSSCSITCGSGGIQSRSRTIRVHASCGGGGCSGPSYETRTCNPGNSVNCVWGNWQEWAACSVSCGMGTSTRTRVKTSAVCGGTDCSSGSPTESRQCVDEDQVNCVWSDWQNWSSCSVTCGSGGSQSRTRSEVTSAFCGGTHCIGSSEEHRSCSNEDFCPDSI
ncbi:adhesion G protein-coupled receptor B1-like [Antedon mediterranea]|uniref:adhesion G protein-coupled receptor B1-like n=1 Tax=Antedon mediterranea TaxID=105859 RepID=UPI003AF805E9